MSTNSIFSRFGGGELFRSLQERFAGCADFETRRVHNGLREFILCWIDGLVASRDISEEVLRPISDPILQPVLELAGDSVEALLSGCVWACSAKVRESADELCADLLNGCCAVIPVGSAKAAVFEVKTNAARSVSSPTAEKTMKGGKDAFVETLRTNTSLVRRKLRTADLKLAQVTVGRRSNTAVAVLYVNELADPTLPARVLERLRSLDVDALRTAGNLEQYITDRPGSLFPQLLHTERPDAFAAELLEGRVGILVDGLPLGFLFPAVLQDFLRVVDDQAQHFAPASLLVLLRWVALGMSLLLPGLATAAALFHPEMIPTRLLLSMIEAKQRVPFSVTVEMLGMFLIFELLMEAGLRLPEPVGDTVSIIGGLIIGQAAVEARIVSPISIIVVAAASICGFALPSRDLAAAIRLLRFIFILLGAMLGLYGVTLGAAVLLRYLVSMESSDASYLSPLSSGTLRDTLKATLQLPMYLDKIRASWTGVRDRRNQR